MARVPLLLAALGTGCTPAAEPASEVPIPPAAPTFAADPTTGGRLVDRDGHPFRDLPASMARWLGVGQPERATRQAASGMSRWHEAELTAGRDVRVTLDPDLHARLETAFEPVERGAAVVVDIERGELLALFSTGEPDDERPFERRNLATTQESPPASTLKPLMAAWALERGVVTEATRHVCTGTFAHEGRTFGCVGKHGDLDVAEALVTSCNSYFFAMATTLSHERVVEAQRGFGLGAAPRVPPGAAAGEVPDAAWYSRRPGGMHSGRTLAQAIGHGDLRATPLQIALAYATLATGRVVEPTVVVAPSTAATTPPAARDPRRSVVRSALARATRSAVESDAAAPNAVGKTGSAHDEVRGEEIGVGWFAGWAPADDPSIAFAFFAEGLTGRDVARIALSPGLIAEAAPQANRTE